MRRVTRRGGRVATCVWDFGGGMTVLRTFWDAAARVSPGAARQYDQAKIRPYSTAEELDALWRSAGIRIVSTGELVVSAGYTDFDDLWDPLVTPDGPSGKFLQGLDALQVEAVRQQVQRISEPPPAPFASTPAPGTRSATRRSQLTPEIGKCSLTVRADLPS